MTICPWCNMEIIWDEELGPEEECPYCHNDLKGYSDITDDEDETESDSAHDHEHSHDDVASSGQAAPLPGKEDLKGYRTLSIQLGDEDEQDILYEAEDEIIVEKPADAPLLQDNELHKLPVLHTLQKFEESGADLMAYEQGAEQILDRQDEVLECSQCGEYMLHAGSQTMTGESFVPSISPALGRPVLDLPFVLNVYVCPSCFHVQQTLSEDDRLRLLEKLSGISNN
ncbi:UNVERIFIED_CONTAM: Zn finger protein HypA/HybF involved in hydrogenase expression [Paenibacillus sp. PvR008]